MEPSLILAVFVSFLLVVVLWLVTIHHRLTFFKRYGITGPKPLLLVGNLHQLLSSRNPNEVLDCWIAKYGNVFGYYKGPRPYLVINDVDVIKSIMIKEFERFRNREDFVVDVEPLSSSLINNRDSHWKKVRRVMTPAFSAAKMRQMLDKMNAHAQRMTEVIEGFGDGDFEVGGVVQALTLDVIGSCALAMEVRSQGNPKDELFLAVREFFKNARNPAIYLAIILPLLRPVFTFMNDHMTASKMTKNIVANLEHVIGLRRTDANTRRNDMLQLIMDAAEAERSGGSTIGDKEVVANAYIFMLAGYETTATALTFTMYLLAKHPEVQERLYREIDGVLGGDDVGLHLPNYENIQAMRYLDQVLQESLRLYPPVTNFITRICQEDVTINGTFIPKGVVVEVPVWHMHHDPDLWPDAMTYNPERFSPESTTPSTNFFAFGIGPRNCIGARFAQLEAKVAIVHTLRKFRLENSPRNEDPLPIVCPTVIIEPKDGVYLRVMPRHS